MITNCRVTFDELSCPGTGCLLPGLSLTSHRHACHLTRPRDTLHGENLLDLSLVMMISLRLLTMCLKFRQINLSNMVPFRLFHMVPRTQVYNQEFSRPKLLFPDA
jgi:hypothetical protein